MSASKDFLLLIEDAESTLQRLSNTMAAIRSVSELSNAPVIGNKASRIVVQQLLNESMSLTSGLVSEIDVLNSRHQKENA